jgi:hypothetical protein
MNDLFREMTFRCELVEPLDRCLDPVPPGPVLLGFAGVALKTPCMGEAEHPDHRGEQQALANQRHKDDGKRQEENEIAAAACRRAARTPTAAITASSRRYHAATFRRRRRLAEAKAERLDRGEPRHDERHLFRATGNCQCCAKRITVFRAKNWFKGKWLCGYASVHMTALIARAHRASLPRFDSSRVFTGAPPQVRCQRYRISCLNLINS